MTRGQVKGAMGRPALLVAIVAFLIMCRTNAFHTPRGIIFGNYPRAASTSLASATAAEARTAPSAVIEKFDGYAPHFEEHLVGNLGYCAPQVVAEAASRRICTARGGRRYGSALDAGCGTGLAGPPLRGLVAGPMIGADLSPGMAALAAELVVDDGPVPTAEGRMRRCAETARLALASDAPERLYDGVFTADLLDLSGARSLDGYGLRFDEMPARPFDLIVSADVLCYFGALDDVLRVFSDKLGDGGDLIFTTETMSSGDYNWVETKSGRYAHHPSYVERLAKACGLMKVSQVAFTPRMESGEKVLGTLHTFTKKIERKENNIPLL